MKVLVTGVNGQLGYDAVKELEKRGIAHKGVCRVDFDLNDSEKMKAYIKAYKPDTVIHCAAYTAVDKAEDEKELCYKVNAEATRTIAEVCREIDAKMLYISTDYVFPGKGERYYEVDDETGPVNVYGQTKLAGELAVKAALDKYFIVRISWVFGENGNNFVKTMLRLGKERDEVNVVADQIGSPTYTADLAELLCDMVVTEKYGTYHATNEGVCSWAEFAEEIFRQTGIKTKVNRIKTAAYPTKAKRPINSRMSKEKLVWAGFCKMPSWQEAVKKYLEIIYQ